MPKIKHRAGKGYKIRVHQSTVREEQKDSSRNQECQLKTCMASLEHANIPVDMSMIDKNKRKYKLIIVCVLFALAEYLHIVV